MRRWRARIIASIAILLLALVALGWSALAVPYFSSFRTAFVSELLSEQIGQPVNIKNDVSVVLGPTSTVRASGVHIPSENIPEVDLALLDSLEFQIDLLALLERNVDVNNLFVDGLEVNILIDEDGSTSYSGGVRSAIGEAPDSADNVQDEAQNAKQQDGSAQNNLLSFLKTRTASFKDIVLIVDNGITGFEYDFDLEELSLAQLDGGSTLEVLSRGTVNDQPFDLKGVYPKGEPFKTLATFSSVTLTFDGQPISDGAGGGYAGDLKLDVAGVGDLLDVLKLDRAFDGQGLLEARIEYKNGQTKIAKIDMDLGLQDGQLITVEGQVKNVDELAGFDLQIGARLHPEGDPPDRAEDIADIRITNIATRIFSRNEALELQDLNLSTNIFAHGLDKIGPVSIGRIRRTDQGTIAFQNIAVQAGPEDAPVVTVKGNINDIFKLKDIDLEGRADAPASFLLRGLEEGVAEKFGGVEVAFALDDAQGVLGLSELAAKSVNTEVWDMTAEMALGDVSSLYGLMIDFRFAIADGADFLTALQLEPVDTGSFGFDMSVTGAAKKLEADFELGSGASALSSAISLSTDQDRPTLRGTVVSDALNLSDLKNGLEALTQLSRIGDQADRDTETGDDEIELQPLVLPDDQIEPKTDEARTTSSTEGDDVSTLEDEPKLISLDEILRETDAYVSFEFKEISGVDGVTSLTSELISESGKAKLGPVEFSYGSGYFNFEASADVLEAPEYVTVAGSTSGWSLSEILDATGVTFDADGDLRGAFRLAGNLSSLETFVSTMKGSATLEMLNGRAATSLLELAGLGVFPWLFSSELNQGYTDLVCVSAPVVIDGKAVSFDAVVAETRRVQLVARGSVDAERDTISIRAEPRPVGEPLARSAWPFDVSGKLSDPKFKLDIGGSRNARADGADKMPQNRVPCQPDIMQLE